MPVWIRSLMHCTVHEMVRDNTHNPDDFKKLQETHILMNKPVGAIATPTMAYLNNLIKKNSALPFTSAEDAYYYANRASAFVSVEGARQGAGCPGYEY